MWRESLCLSALLAAVRAAPHSKRLDNGLALKPPMGWNSYNHYSCHPNQSIIESNAKALKDFGLADLGYTYVTTDCGWTIPNRTADGKLTWNPDAFPDGLPAVGEYIHNLGLHFGVYSDSGVQMCMTGQPNQTGSLYHEQTDAETFASWGADLLKYDNCYSSPPDYPNTDYTPATSPAPRFATMRDALAATGKSILYQICEWGLDFPSAWAPKEGNTWRITNDIIPEWKTVYRIMNQFVPSAGVAGPGQWPDLDMLEVGNNIFTEAEEQTHFTLWAMAKSPLVIGGVLNDTMTSIKPSSLALLKNEAVIAVNQDSLGQAANLTRRYTQAGFDVWSGPLSDRRTVAALVNWNNATVMADFFLPDAGLQSAGMIKDIWNNKTISDVVTSYSASIPPHGTLLLELSDTTPAGTYSADRCGRTSKHGLTFEYVYGITDGMYDVTLEFVAPVSKEVAIPISSAASKLQSMIKIKSGSKSGTATVSLSAGGSNTISLGTSANAAAIHVSRPGGTFYSAPSFETMGTASHVNCTANLCAPVGAKIGYLTANGSACITVPASAHAVGSKRYVELTYINNDVSLDTSWTNGTNSRNITLQVNDAEPVRLDTPLSGRSSELFSPMKGWGDSAVLGVLVDGFKSGGGKDVITVGNAGGDAGVQHYGADFVGLRVI